MGVLEYNQEQIPYVSTLVQYVELNIFVLDLLITDKEKICVALPNHVYIINPANAKKSRNSLNMLCDKLCYLKICFSLFNVYLGF